MFVLNSQLYNIMYTSHWKSQDYRSMCTAWCFVSPLIPLRSHIRMYIWLTKVRFQIPIHHLLFGMCRLMLYGFHRKRTRRTCEWANMYVPLKHDDVSLTNELRARICDMHKHTLAGKSYKRINDSTFNRVWATSRGAFNGTQIIHATDPQIDRVSKSTTLPER